MYRCFFSLTILLSSVYFSAAHFAILRLCLRFDAVAIACNIYISSVCDFGASCIFSVSYSIFIFARDFVYIMIFFVVVAPLLLSFPYFFFPAPTEFMCVFLTLSSRQCMNACGLRSICSGCCSMQLSAANIRLDVAYEAHKYPFLAMHQFHKRQKKMDIM